MEHIVELVVVDDQAFSLVDHAAFQQLLMFQSPLPKIAISPTARALPKLSMRKRKRRLKGHSSDNLASLVMDIINNTGLTSKIGWITSDNVTSNDKMLHTVVSGALCTLFTWQLSTSFKHSLKKALSWNRSSQWTPPHRSDKDSKTWYGSDDTLGKLWAFINQVRLSPQASAFIFKCCADEGLPHLELIKYVWMRWSSMYDLLKRAFLSKLGITKFIQLANDSTQVPKLQKKMYKDYKLMSNEWTNLDLLRQVLKHPALAQQEFSSKRIPTVSRIFPTIKFLLMSLEAAKKNTVFKPIRSSITAGITNLTKWYRKLDTCHVYAVSNMFDPSVKLVYIKRNWGPNFMLRIKTIIFTIFDKYNQTAKDIGAVATPSSQPVNNNSIGYGSNWMQMSLGDDSDDEDIDDPCKELTQYLESGREVWKEGLVEWWG
ncbi:ribonuclease H-like domain-containing protein [Lactarius quietus]|nr:ribonuclease H-like domain-containing protein [Lactarius quietus]